MKKVKQFLFYGEGNNNNSPKSLTDWTVNLFTDYAQVSHLGIQGEPGIIFYLNNGSDPISIGATGVYELYLGDNITIDGLRFKKDILLEKYDNDSNPYHRLIVDIVYEGLEG